jgi:predicted Fe-Mo cluster-binding NifX family protein
MKRFTGLLLLLALVLPPTVFAAGPAAVGVAAEGKDPSSPVSPVAARCPYLLLFDEKGTLVEAEPNPYKDARGGAGIRAADLLAGKGVKVVVAGEFGPRMAGAMKERGIRYLAFKGNTADAVKKALAK